MRLLLLLCWAVVLAAVGATDTTARICEASGSKDLTSVRGPCPDGTAAKRIASVNIFDSLWVTSTGMVTCCNATGGPAVSKDAVAALEAAQQSNIRVFRFFASLFGAAGRMWVENPAEYWQQFDGLIDTIEQNGLYCIPSIGTGKLWSQVANAVTPGLNESTNDVIMNTSSVSWALNAKYFDEIVRRYRHRKGVLFWELGNELNLGVNLGPQFCGGEQCYNTSAMVAYTQQLVSIIKAADPVRPISSGFSAGRGSEWHQEHCPAGTGPYPSGSACTGGYWALDSEEQWLEMFERQNAAVDIMSIHHYKDDKACWFNKSYCGMANVGLVTLAAQRAKSIGKTIYVGEYGGAGPNFTGPTAADQAFPAAMLDLQVAAGAAAPIDTGASAGAGAGHTEETGAACLAALRSSCSTDRVKAHSPFASRPCGVCAGQLQRQLRRAGCTNADIARYCAEADVDDGSSFMLSTIWAFESPSHRKDMTEIWPGSSRPKESGSARMLQLIDDANKKMDAQAQARARALAQAASR